MMIKAFAIGLIMGVTLGVIFGVLFMVALQAGKDDDNGEFGEIMTSVNDYEVEE